MREIQLEVLRLENFKGCRQLSLELLGRNTNIYGDNATGKSTIYDALIWLLFGKDSQGQSNFDIKPLDVEGNVRDHGAVTTVEAVLQICEGETPREISLKRTYYEKWTSKRGQANQTFDGNTSDFFVDGVPVKKYAFEETVSKLAGEELFRLLTDVTYFSGKLDWKSRRNTLFAVCDVPPDHEILGLDPRFSPLSDACGGRISAEDLKKKLLAERKGLSGTRNQIPVRLDECQKTLDGLQGIDFGALRAERDQRVTQKESLESELRSLEHNTLLDGKRNQKAAAQNRLDKLEIENTAHRCNQAAPPDSRRPALETTIQGGKKQLLALENRIQNEQEQADFYEKQIAKCRDLWHREAARTFTGAACPTCGQTLPADRLQKAKAQFEEERRLRQVAAVEESDRYKEQLRAAQARREQLIQETARQGSEIAQYEAELADLPPAEEPMVEDLPDYTPRRAALLEELAALDQEISQLSREGAGVRDGIVKKLSTLREEIAAIEGTLAQEAVIASTRNRMDALRKEAQTASEQLDALDGLLDLCEDFSRYKVQFIENKINSRFQLARFRLFTEQVNGGLADCCEVMVGGVPYSSLNNGARINAGLDIIQTLSAYHGVRVPLFIDNAESVTKFLPLDAQVIRMVVSGADKELRCEYGT